MKTKVALAKAVENMRKMQAEAKRLAQEAKKERERQERERQEQGE